MSLSTLTLERDTTSAWTFCHGILPSVSRTFALTIPVLPRVLGDSVCCAYLLCRIADTIEDRVALSAASREALYDHLRRLLTAPTDVDALRAFGASWPAPRDGEAEVQTYQALMLGVPEVFSAYATLSVAHQRAVAACVEEMVAGMADLGTRGPSSDGVTYVCDDLAGLEHYCHYVAGTVGLMLTRLFALELGPGFVASPERLEQGRRFGLGLQLTNILKDHSADRERGTSFVPAGWFDGPQAEQRRRELVARTIAHLDEAEAYTLALPARAEGVRLFCLWALWMAAATLREVSRGVSKISRAEVAQIVDESRRHVDDDAALHERYTRYRQDALGVAS